MYMHPAVIFQQEIFSALAVPAEIKHPKQCQFTTLQFRMHLWNTD